MNLHLIDVVRAGPHQDFSLAYFVACLNKLCMYTILHVKTDRELCIQL